MTQQRARALAKRQQELLVRSSELRLQIAADLGRWQAPLAVADEARRAGGQAWRWLRAHPELPLAGAAALVLMRPRRVLGFCLRWGRRALWAKRLAATLGRLFAARGPAPGAPGR